jgi:hypothetical protein
MYDTPSDAVLQHYGIPGMKWGKRKGSSDSSGSSKSSKSKEPAHEDATKAKEIKVKAKKSGTDSLSNTELQTAITRLNLEKQYSTLSPSSTKAGKKIATDLLQKQGKQLANQVLKSGVDLAMKTAIDAAKKAA